MRTVTRIDPDISSPYLEIVEGLLQNPRIKLSSEPLKSTEDFSFVVSCMTKHGNTEEYVAEYTLNSGLVLFGDGFAICGTVTFAKFLEFARHLRAEHRVPETILNELAMIAYFLQPNYSKQITLYWEIA